MAATWSHSALFLGPHGIWTSRRAEEFLRQGYRGIGRLRRANADRLAKANPE